MRRRAPSEVPSSIRLDHGDILVMDGPAKSEYEHCTASGLEGSRVNLTYRWVTQHAASCPLAGVVGCVLRSCVQGLAEPGVGDKWTSFWGLVLLLLILVFFLLVSTWIHNGGRHCDSGRRSSHLAVHLGDGPVAWSCPLGWETALATVTFVAALPFSKEEPTPFYFPVFFGTCEGRYGQTHCKTTFSPPCICCFSG